MKIWTLEVTNILEKTSKNYKRVSDSIMYPEINGKMQEDAPEGAVRQLSFLTLDLIFELNAKSNYDKFFKGILNESNLLELMKEEYIKCFNDKWYQETKDFFNSLQESERSDDFLREAPSPHRLHTSLRHHGGTKKNPTVGLTLGTFLHGPKELEQTIEAIKHTNHYF